MKDWDMDDTGAAILIGALASVVILILVALTADHSVRGYYLGSGTAAGTVRARVEWNEDPIVFETDDIDKALKVVATLNAEMTR